jgi:hypothetical protein
MLFSCLPRFSDVGEDPTYAVICYLFYLIPPSYQQYVLKNILKPVQYSKLPF